VPFSLLIPHLILPSILVSKFFTPLKAEVGNKKYIYWILREALIHIWFDAFMVLLCQPQIRFYVDLSQVLKPNKSYFSLVPTINCH